MVLVGGMMRSSLTADPRYDRSISFSLVFSCCMHDARKQRRRCNDENTRTTATRRSTGKIASGTERKGDEKWSTIIAYGKLFENDSACHHDRVAGGVQRGQRVTE